MTTTNRILLKKSSVEGKIPSASDVEFGELALNFSDGRLYFKNSDNLIDFFSSGSSSESSTLPFAVNEANFGDLTTDESNKLTFDLGEITNTETFSHDFGSLTEIDGVNQVINTTDDLSEGLTNLYYLDSRVDNHLNGGTGVSYSSGTISIGQDVSTTDDVTFNDVTVDGDLIVNGTNTTLNTTTLDVEDLNITVASGATSATTANGAGLTVNLGSDGTVDFTYDSSNDRLSSNKSIATDIIGTVSDITNHDTDDLSEGVSNLYYTDTRVRNAVSVSGDLSYNSTTGTFSFTERTDAEVRGLLSATGDLSYDSTTGTFSFTERTDAEVRGLLSATGDLSYDSTTGVFSFTERTDAEVRGLLSATGDLSYNSTTGTFSFTERTDAEVRGLLSATGDLSYNSTTGTFSFTERSESQIRDLFSASGDLTYNSSTGTFSVTSYTTADFDTDFTVKTTNDLSEGSVNLYYTDARVDARIGDGILTVSGGSGLTGSGTFDANASSNNTITINHADTSSQGSVNGSGNTFIQDVTLDTFGHVTGLGTATVVIPDTANDATITVSAGTGLSGGGDFTTDQSTNETISLSVDTSTIATRSYVNTELSNLVDSSPSTLDTLNELAAALGDDPDFATTVSNQIGTKADETTTISAGSGLTGGGDLSTNRTISHADTSSQSSVNNSGGTVIQDVTLDGFGHVTNLNSKTLTASDTSYDNTSSDLSSTDVKSALDEIADNFAPLLIEGNTQTGNYTLQLSDIAKVIEMDNSSAATVTIPSNANVQFPIGTVINIYAQTSNTVTIQGQSGVTVRNSGDIANQFKEVSCRKRATDEWVLVGDII